MQTLLVLYDGDVLVSIDYDPERTVDSQLDEYAKKYSKDRTHLTGMLVEKVRLAA